MLVENKKAVIFGGSGAIGRSIAKVLAREGAHLYLVARNHKKLEEAANEIRTIGKNVEIFCLDVLNEQTTIEQISLLSQKSNGIDIVINATGFMHEQGKEISELSLEEFMQGISPFLIAQFNISKAVSPHMGGERSGTIINIVAPSSSMPISGHLGHIVGCAGIEAFSKALATELGSKNIRVICLRSHAIVGAIQAGSYTREIFEAKALAMGITVEQWLEGAAQSTMLHRLPTLSDVAETVTFLASDHAHAMTATIVNMTAGATIN
jgi:NAD(P)-dependent dehydrogenase (short-subunit alcohol dehydrogenase family)